MLLDHLATLLATLCIELAIVALVAPREQRGRCLATALFANLLTHSLAGYALLLAIPGIDFLRIELLVIGVEWLAFRFVAGLPLGTAAKLALLSNAATIAGSLLLSSR
jgi:hypothetical protein